MRSDNSSGDEPTRSLLTSIYNEREKKIYIEFGVCHVIDLLVALVQEPMIRRDEEREKCQGHSVKTTPLV